MPLLVPKTQALHRSLTARCLTADRAPELPDAGSRRAGLVGSQ